MLFLRKKRKMKQKESYDSSQPYEFEKGLKLFMQWHIPASIPLKTQIIQLWKKRVGSFQFAKEFAALWTINIFYLLQIGILQQKYTI